MNHGKKMIARIIITMLLVLYYGGLAIVFILCPGIPFLLRLLTIVIPLALAGTMIGVLVSRIREIKGGEEDDLSKY